MEYNPINQHTFKIKKKKKTENIMLYNLSTDC